MAKKKVTTKVNKSEEIRNYKVENPEAGPTEIAGELSKAGVEVTPAQVSNVLGKVSGPKKRRRRKAKKPATVAAPATSNVEQLKAAARLIAECGGVSEAQKALKVAAEIVKVLR